LAATGTAPIHIALDPASAGAGVDDLLAAVLRANPRISDLIFSPGRKLQVQVNGTFVAVDAPALSTLSADDTRRIASHLIGNNKAAIAILREQGYCDISYAVPGVARFRVNVFIQRGSCAIVIRVIPTEIPDLRALGAPQQFERIATLRTGLVLVTGPRGCGKSSTLAALVDHINESGAGHIITIEDPIEFLHNHKRATVHQRELYSDTPSISLAMRAALRQAPNVIVIGELKDREGMELALEAAETGHLVLSTVAAPTPAKAVHRYIGVFAQAEQTVMLKRLGRMLRLIICQRLVPRQKDGGPVAIFEMVAESAFEPLLRPQPNETDEACLGSHTSELDRQIEELFRNGIITAETALAYASDPAQLSARLAPA
jgi:twitching motility protein PilT